MISCVSDHIRSLDLFLDYTPRPKPPVRGLPAPVALTPVAIARGLLAPALGLPIPLPMPLRGMPEAPPALGLPNPEGLGLPMPEGLGLAAEVLRVPSVPDAYRGIPMRDVEVVVVVLVVPVLPPSVPGLGLPAATLPIPGLGLPDATLLSLAIGLPPAVRRPGLPEAMREFGLPAVVRVLIAVGLLDVVVVVVVVFAIRVPPLIIGVLLGSRCVRSRGGTCGFGLPRGLVFGLPDAAVLGLRRPAELAV